MVVLGVVVVFLLQKNVFWVMHHGFIHIQNQGEFPILDFLSKKGGLRLVEVFLMLIPNTFFGVFLNEIEQVLGDLGGRRLFVSNFLSSGRVRGVLWVLETLGLFSTLKRAFVGQSVGGPTAQTHHSVFVSCKKHSHKLFGVQGKVNQSFTIEDHSKGGKESVVFPETETFVEIERRHKQKTIFVDFEEILVLFTENLQQRSDDSGDQVVDLLQMMPHLVFAPLFLGQTEIGLFFGKHFFEFGQVLGLLPVVSLSPGQKQLDFVDQNRIQILDNVQHFVGQFLQIHLLEDFEVDIGGVQRKVLGIAVFHQKQKAN